MKEIFTRSLLQRALRMIRCVVAPSDALVIILIYC